MGRSGDGTVSQSGLMQQPGDYDHERLYAPVVGVVLNVHWSDDPLNASAKPFPDQRGSQTTCDVLAIGHGNDNPWIIPNVTVLPEGPSGVDDFCEAIPRPCSQMTDGSTFDSRLSNIDYTKLDGDYCVILFIGGSIEQPVMIKWWPHPGNRQDPATLGFPVQTPSQGQTNAQTLSQGRRYFRRYRGLKYTITDQGSFFADTNESNSSFTGAEGGPDRNPSDDGGDIQIDVKKNRQLQVNFNPPVALPKTQPSLPQPNPPQGEDARATDRTTVTYDKDLIRLLAGKVIEMITSDDYIDLHAKTKVRVHGDDNSDTVLLGDTDPSNMDHALKAETFRDNFYNKLVYAVIHHKHGTPVGPTSEPTPDPNPLGPMPPDNLGAAAITNFVKVKK